MSSAHKSRPRTRIVSSFEDEIAELRCACGPIFTGSTIFRIAKSASPCEHGPRVAPGLSRTRPDSLFRIAKYSARMKRRTAAPRREAMGGLAKGLDVIRAFTRESPSLTLSEIAAPRAAARRHCAPLPAHARRARLRHAVGPQFPAAAEGARARRRVSRVDEHRDADQDLPGGSRAPDRRFRGAHACSTARRSCTWRARRCAR